MMFVYDFSYLHSYFRTPEQIKLTISSFFNNIIDQIDNKINNRNSNVVKFISYLG